MEQKQATLGDLLYRARSTSGMSMRELSAETGIAIATLHSLEHDVIRTPNPGHLAKLSAVLGVSIYDLYAAAGFALPTELIGFGPEFLRQMASLSPEARRNLQIYVNDLWREEHPEAGEWRWTGTAHNPNDPRNQELGYDFARDTWEDAS